MPDKAMSFAADDDPEASLPLLTGAPNPFDDDLSPLPPDLPDVAPEPSLETLPPHVRRAARRQRAKADLQRIVTGQVISTLSAIHRDTVHQLMNLLGYLAKREKQMLQLGLLTEEMQPQWAQMKTDLFVTHLRVLKINQQRLEAVVAELAALPDTDLFWNGWTWADSLKDVLSLGEYKLERQGIQLSFKEQVPNALSFGLVALKAEADYRTGKRQAWRRRADRQQNDYLDVEGY